MEKLNIFYDEIGSTLTIWFGEPNTEYICEETGNETILIKNSNNDIIGLEKINVKIDKSKVYNFTNFQILNT